MAPAAVSAPRPGPSKLQKPTKVRYFKGKPLGAELDDEESDQSDDGEEEIDLRRAARGAAAKSKVTKADEDVVAGGAGRVWRGNQKGAEVKVELGGVKVGRAMPVKKEEEEEEESEEDESDEEDEVPPARAGIPKPPGEESSEYETDSEEESEEEVKKPAFRPVFIRKDQRGMTQEKAQAEAEKRQQEEEELREKRKNDSKEIAGETIRREIAEKEAADIQPDVDDTDNLDPSAEFEQWRARELARLLREKQAQAARDEEKEEIERRRALPEEQRLREDMEFAEETRNKEKTQMGFMQKYYHKGAFYSEDNLLERDYTGATESAVDMSMLPKVMQVKDYGKASRTKYTHLADQDTSQGGWGNAAKVPASMGMGGGPGLGDIGTTQTGCWNCGGPHQRKDCPNQNINDPLVRAGVNTAGSGANASQPGGYGNFAGGGYGSRSGGGGGSGGRDEFGGRERDSGYGNRAGGSSRYEGDRSRDGPSRDRYDERNGSGRREVADDRRDGGRERPRDDGRSEGRNRDRDDRYDDRRGEHRDSRRDEEGRNGHGRSRETDEDDRRRRSGEGDRRDRDRERGTRKRDERDEDRHRR